VIAKRNCPQRRGPTRPQSQVSPRSPPLMLAASAGRPASRFRRRPTTAVDGRHMRREVAFGKEFLRRSINGAAQVAPLNLAEYRIPNCFICSLYGPGRAAFERELERLMPAESSIVNHCIAPQHGAPVARRLASHLHRTSPKRINEGRDFDAQPDVRDGHPGRRTDDGQHGGARPVGPL
jgi:hypothetical protein